MGVFEHIELTLGWSLSSLRGCITRSGLSGTIQVIDREAMRKSAWPGCDIFSTQNDIARLHLEFRLAIQKYLSIYARPGSVTSYSLQFSNPVFATAPPTTCLGSPRSFFLPLSTPCSD